MYRGEQVVLICILSSDGQQYWYFDTVSILYPISKINVTSFISFLGLAMHSKLMNE